MLKLNTGKKNLKNAFFRVIFEILYPFYIFICAGKFLEVNIFVPRPLG